jgi:hypothetical protein
MSARVKARILRLERHVQRQSASESNRKLSERLRAARERLAQYRSAQNDAIVEEQAA